MKIQTEPGAEKRGADSMQRLVRARISTIMLKTGRFTFGAAFAGLAIILLAGLAKSWLAMTYGVAVTASGMGGCMVLSAIGYQLQTGGILERPNESSSATRHTGAENNPKLL